MEILGDSNAVCLPGRTLPQHQAALGLVKSRLESPSVTSFRWLDLACGQGQILVGLSDVLTPACRGRIHYLGIDVSNVYARRVEMIAAEHALATTRVEVCSLANYEALLKSRDRFDAITFTNTAHEVSPDTLASTIVGAISRLTPAGFLYMYDMEKLPEPELGAISWRGPEMTEVVVELLRAAGEQVYTPSASVWQNANYPGWDIQVHRRNIRVGQRVLHRNRPTMIVAASRAIRERLMGKFLETDKELEILRRTGAGSGEERTRIVRLLYANWALAKALGVGLEA